MESSSSSLYGKPVSASEAAVSKNAPPLGFFSGQGEAENRALGMSHRYAGVRAILVELENPALIDAFAKGYDKKPDTQAMASEYANLVDSIVAKLKGRYPGGNADVASFLSDMSEILYGAKFGPPVVKGYGQNSFDFLWESLQTGKWDCQNISLLVFDVARELGFGDAVLAYPAMHVYPGVGGQYLEVTSITNLVWSKQEAKDIFGRIIETGSIDEIIGHRYANFIWAINKYVDDNYLGSPKAMEMLSLALKYAELCPASSVMHFQKASTHNLLSKYDSANWRSHLNDALKELTALIDEEKLNSGSPMMIKIALIVRTGVNLTLGNYVAAVADSEEAEKYVEPAAKEAERRSNTGAQGLK